MSEALRRLDHTQLMTLFATANEDVKKEIIPEIERRQMSIQKHLNFQKQELEEQLKIYDMFNSVTKIEPIVQVQTPVTKLPTTQIKQVPLMNLDIPKPITRTIPPKNIINHQKHFLIDLPVPDKWLKNYKITQMGKPVNNMCKYDIVMESIPEEDTKMIDNNSGSFELYVNNGIDQVIHVIIQRGIGRYIGIKNVKK